MLRFIAFPLSYPLAMWAVLAPLSFPLAMGGMAVTVGGCSPERSGPPHAVSGSALPVLSSASDASPGADAPDGPAAPYQAEPPRVYVAKVKNILVGLTPTDAEIQAVEADPTQLKTLIAGWMNLPQYPQKLLTFFELAFQQTQITITDLADQTYPRQADVNASTAPSLLQNVEESFARTVLEIVSEERPLTDAITTQSLMMTPALMEFYAFLDTWQVDDSGTVTDGFHRANPDLTITVEAAQGPIPLAETLDPTNANYMTWYDPDVANDANSGTGCGQDPITYPAAADTLHYLLYGSLVGRKNAAGGTCTQTGGTAQAPQLNTTDFSTWTMVHIRPPAAGESPTAFYDLATLRTTSELVLSVPRVGFFTPAFFANWQTNTSNQMRVTLNQALIVAEGAAVDGTDPTVPPSTPGLDAVHAASPDCFFCHQTLDPTRSILAATYSWNYHTQADTTFSGQDGLFAFQGVIQNVSSLGDLTTTLAGHPLFAQAWVQKLCYYVNSSACETTDPEFQRIVGVFKASNYSWNVLVSEILASPLTTNAAPTQTTTDQGEVVAIARRDHLCAAYDVRLGLTDVCGLDALTKAATQTTIPEIVSGLPSDGYGRGAVAPVLPNAPTLFYRAGAENICEAVAALVIDNTTPETTGTIQWSSAQPDAAIADFVQIVMALTPSDPRSAPAQALLQTHFASAVASGASASNALKSTFVAACLAPSALSIGL